MQYRKKDQDRNKTDSAYEQAPRRDGDERPRGRGGNRGGGRGRGAGGDRGGGDRGRPATATTRGGYDNKRGGETRDRPQTTRGRGGGDRGGGDRGGRSYQGAGGGGRRPIDPTSFQWKYRNEERPTFEKIAVNADTVLPPLPSKDDMKTEPSKNELDKKLRDLDRIVEDRKLKNEEARHHRNIVRDGGKVDGSNADYRGQITL